MNTESPLPVRKSIWQKAIAPHPSVKDKVERRFATVLAILLLVLVPLYFLPEGIRAIVEKHPARDILYFGTGVVILGIAYLFSRSPYPRWGSRLTLLYFTFIPFAALLTQAERYSGENARNSLIWSVPIMLMAFILLRPAQIKLVVAFNIGLYLVIPALWSGLSYEQVASTLWVVIATSGLMMVSATMQNSYLRKAEAEAENSRLNEIRYRDIFFSSPVALWEVDFSIIKSRLKLLSEKYGDDLMKHLLADSKATEGLASSVVLIDANQAAFDLYETDNLENLQKKRLEIIKKANENFALRDGAINLWTGKNNFPVETIHQTRDGKIKDVILQMAVGLGYEDTWERVIVSITDVTEQRAAQASVRQLASAVEASASSVVITDLDGNIEYVNPAFSEVTGYTREEATGENPRVLKSGQHSAEFYQEMWDVLIKGDTWSGEIINKKKNGELYWERATISPVKNDIGETVNYVAVKDDITEKMKSEADFRKLSNASEQTASAIVITDTKGVIEYVNPAFTKITGYSREEAIGENPSLLKSGKHPQDFYTNLWKTVEKGEVWRGELINRRKDGSFYWESQVISPVRNKEGKTTHYVAVKDDITKIKETEIKLRNLSNATEQSANGIVISNTEGYIEYINPAFTLISGYSQEETLGKKLEDLQKSGEHAEAFYAQLNETIDRGGIWKGEIINRRKDGSLYWEALVISPVRNEKGEITHRVEIKEDVTQRKELEQALALAHEEALVASDMKTQLLANVSHDMRTPLGSILGYTEMLDAGIFEPLNDKQAEATRAIAASSQKLLNFVSNLLNQAQIDTGEIILNETAFNPQQLLEGLGGEISLARTQGLILEISIDENLPQNFIGDSYWLGQIIHNLLSNAIKFTPRGGEINIRLLRSGDDAWKLEVEDNGKGIPLEAQAYIFESFRQVDGSITREAHTGSGLGLSIVNHLVRLMRGEIRLESELGKGSKFIVLLPLNENKE